MIDFNGFQVPNLASEMKLKEFSNVASILNSKHIDDIDKWQKLLKFWGMPEEDRMKLRFKYLKEKAKEWQKSEQKKVEIQKEFTIDGYVYTSHNCFDENDNFDPDVSQVAFIKKALGKENYICDMIAVLFHREDLSLREHYAGAHIKHKSKLFAEQNAEFAVSYLALFGKYLVEQKEAEAKEAESNANSKNLEASKS